MKCDVAQGPLRPGVRGFSLLELMIVLAILSGISFVVYNLVLTTNILSGHSQAWASMTEWGQHGVNSLAAELASLRHIYGNDTEGNLYLAALQPPTTHPRCNNDRLPTKVDLGTFRRDVAGSEQTGNCILIGKQVNPFTATLTSGQPRRIDQYSLVLFYLSPVNKAMGPYPRSLRLARWESTTFADWGEVTSLAVPDRTAVAQQLFTSGVTHLWAASNQDPAAAFYLIDGLGNVSASADPVYHPAQATNTTMIPSLGLGFAGIAWNRSGTRWIKDPVPNFALANATGDGFPNGFEVQVVGESGARTMLLRLTVADFVGVDRSLDSFTASVIANGREF